jgi:hypothetical protein
MKSQDILCSLGKHDWEEIKTVSEITYTKGKIRICKNCSKSQKCEEKREEYTEWE